LFYILLEYSVVPVINVIYIAALYTIRILLVKCEFMRNISYDIGRNNIKGIGLYWYEHE
jgi:hypothetical protein